MLYYRTAEGCFQERLKHAYQGFDCGRPDYQLLPIGTDQLLTAFNQTLGKLARPPESKLPSKIGFVDAAIILRCLDDEMLRRVKLTETRGLSHLVRLTEARNKSLLAHGEQRVSATECGRLESEALNILRALWHLHADRENLDDVCEGLRFLKDV